MRANAETSRARARGERVGSRLSVHSASGLESMTSYLNTISKLLVEVRVEWRRNKD